MGSHKSISVNVSSYPFVQEIEDVIIGYKPSGTNIEYGLAFKKATCENIGKYNMTIKYSDGNAKSLELEITLEGMFISTYYQSNFPEHLIKCQTLYFIIIQSRHCVNYLKCVCS